MFVFIVNFARNVELFDGLLIIFCVDMRVFYDFFVVCFCVIRVCGKRWFGFVLCTFLAYLVFFG